MEELIFEDEVEDADVVEVKTEQENQIIPIMEGTTLSNYTDNVNENEFKSLKCQNCEFATGSEATFRSHLDICNNISKSSSKFQCNLCIKSFNSQPALNAHLKYHTIRREKISRTELRLDKKQMKNSGVVKSPNTANFKRNYKCKDCNRCFTTLGKLNIHQKQHKQQMICNTCHKKYVLKKNFVKHLLSHTNVTMFNGKCVSGTKITKGTDGIRKKQNILLKKKLFRCSYCTIDYRTKKCLAQHKRQYHSSSKLSLRKVNSTIVKCNWCSVRITKCNLLRHIKNLHPNIYPIKCRYCPMAFKDRVSLKLHKHRFD